MDPTNREITTERLESVKLQDIGPTQFVRNFFAGSTVSAEQKRNSKITALLNQLESKGCEIDPNMVVFGPSGEYWPCLNNPNGNIVSKDAIGVRGSHGSGIRFLDEYLEAKEMEGTAPPIARFVATPNVVSNPDTLANLLETLGITQKPSTVATSTAISVEALTLKNPRNKLFTSKTLSLEDLRVGEIFVSDPPEKINSLTVEELFGTELYITQEEKYVIIKNSRILACSPDVTILPTAMPGFYDHGNNRFSDEPCNNYRVRMPLRNYENIRSILPYLQGIALH